jgi:hypothetical protein
VQPLFVRQLHLLVHFQVMPLFCSFMEQNPRFSEQNASEKNVFEA